MATPGPVEAAITAKLSAAFDPSHLHVLNESGNHNVPPGSESHFKVRPPLRAARVGPR